MVEFDANLGTRIPLYSKTIALIFLEYSGIRRKFGYNNILLQYLIAGQSEAGIKSRDRPPPRRSFLLALIFLEYSGIRRKFEYNNISYAIKSRNLLHVTGRRRGVASY